MAHPEQAVDLAKPGANRIKPDNNKVCKQIDKVKKPGRSGGSKKADGRSSARKSGTAAAESTRDERVREIRELIVRGQWDGSHRQVLELAGRWKISRALVKSYEGLARTLLRLALDGSEKKDVKALLVARLEQVYAMSLLTVDHKVVGGELVPVDKPSLNVALSAIEQTSKLLGIEDREVVPEVPVDRAAGRQRLFERLNRLASAPSTGSLSQDGQGSPGAGPSRAE